jgi:hypothetical protein
MPGSALLDRWLRIDYRPFDSGNRASAALLAPITGPFVVGVFAAMHEWFADATPYSTDEIIIGYTVYGAGFSYMLCALLGWPYAIVFDRWIGMPRAGFIVGAAFIGLCVGWALLGVLGGWIFALSGAITSLTYILLTPDA